MLGIHFLHWIARNIRVVKLLGFAILGNILINKTSCVIMCDVIKNVNVLKTILIFSINMTRTCCTFHPAKSKDVYLIAFSLIIIFTSLDGINEFMTKNVN